MGRYVFRLAAAQMRTETSRTDLPTVQDAKRAAAAYLGEVMRAFPESFADDARLTVTDEAGTILFMIDLAVVESFTLLRSRGSEPAA